MKKKKQQNIHIIRAEEGSIPVRLTKSKKTTLSTQAELHDRIISSTISLSRFLQKRKQNPSKKPPEKL